MVSIGPNKGKAELRRIKLNGKKIRLQCEK